MTVSKPSVFKTAASKSANPKTAIAKVAADLAAPPQPVRKEPADAAGESNALQMGELSELLGYSLKRAQLKVFEDFLRCVAPLQLTPAQFSVLLLLDRNPGRNQTEIANTLGILRPNFVAMLDGLESRDLCTRMRSTNDRRSHILVLTDKGRAVLARAKKLVAAKHEARLNELLGPANRAALLGMLATIALEF
jgi:DNA-binding MarR family transcriptional regulator